MARQIMPIGDWKLLRSILSALGDELSRHDRALLRLAVLAWGVTFVVVVGLQVAGLLRHAVPFEVYITAAETWLSHEPLYNTQSTHGFQYLPHAAMLFVPFERLGSPAGDILWRLVGWGACASGVWRLARRLAPARPQACFFIATALVIAPAVGSLGNGQANLVMVGLMMHTAGDLIGHRWGRAAAWLCLGLAIKPLMAVPLLLVWALYPPLLWRLPLAVGLLLLAPWLVRDHAYVVAQYSDCVAKLSTAAEPERLYENARGLLVTIGWGLPDSTLFVVRVMAALGVLGLAIRARCRLREINSIVLVFALAASYLMLFNPRTQSNSYVMTAPFAALLAARGLLDKHAFASVAMSLVVLGWYGNSHWMGFPEFWLKPLVCAVFAGLLVREIFAASSERTQEAPMAPTGGSNSDPVSTMTSDRRLHSSSVD